MIFTRNHNDDALYRWKTLKADGTVDDATLPKEGKIVINEFYIRVPITTYEDTSKIQLVNELQTLSSKNQYILKFKTWQCICQKNVNGRTLNFDITNIYRNVNNPLFGVVVFQTNRSNDQLKDPSGYDHCDVKNLWFEINGHRYPEEQLNLDWDEENWAVAYDMLQDYKRVFHKTHQELPLMYVNPVDFKTGKPILAVDFTRQPWTNGKSNIILHVDFNKNVAAATDNNEGTLCYVIIISNVVFSYDILNNTIKEEL